MPTYTFESYSDVLIKFTEYSTEILFKKVYCSTDVDGDYLIFMAHDLETGKLQQQYRLLYSDCTSPVLGSALLLQSAVDAMIVDYATKSLISYTCGSLIIASLVDSTTYYMGQSLRALSTSAGLSPMFVPFNCTIIAASIQSYAATAGSNEAWSVYIRVNNTTDTLIQTLSANTNARYWSNTALSISLTAGDYFEIKFVCPAWATNPGGGVYASGNIIIRTLL